MDSHCIYQNYPIYFLAHDQLRFLSGDVFSLFTCKFRRVNSEWCECNWLLKGMLDETLIGLFHKMIGLSPKHTPIPHYNNRDKPF